MLFLLIDLNIETMAFPRMLPAFLASVSQWRAFYYLAIFYGACSLHRKLHRQEISKGAISNRFSKLKLMILQNNLLDFSYEAC